MSDSRTSRTAVAGAAAAAMAAATEAAAQTRIDRSDFYDEETGLPNLIVDLQEKRGPGGQWDFHPNRGPGGGPGHPSPGGGGDGGNLGWYPFS